MSLTSRHSYVSQSARSTRCTKVCVLTECVLTEHRKRTAGQRQECMEVYVPEVISESRLERSEHKTYAKESSVFVMCHTHAFLYTCVVSTRENMNKTKVSRNRMISSGMPM